MYGRAPRRIHDRTGKTLLWHAVDTGDVACVEHLLSVGCAKCHDPTKDPRNSPWLHAHRLGDARLFDVLSVYLDPSVNDEVLDGLVAYESQRLSRLSRRRTITREATTCAWFAALFPCGDGACLEAAEEDGDPEPDGDLGDLEHL